MSHDSDMTSLKDEANNLIRKKNAQILGWELTALAMRDAAICWDLDGKNRCDEIQRMYFDAALLGKYTEMYRRDNGQ